MKAHDAQPQQSVPEQLLAQDDGTLASSLVGIMCSSPRPENFEAFGKILRAGVAVVGVDELANVVRRPKR